MFTIRIAELVIAIDNRFDFSEKFCAKYIVHNDDYDFKVSVTEKEIESERIALDTNASDGFIESVCIYRNIANELPKYNAFVFHCASIEFDSMAYCFTAKSGTGKTTHISLWKKVYGDKVNIINGDKPIIRFIDGVPMVYGTPWSGKENLNRNVSFPLKAICFLEQNPSNFIVIIDKYDALNRILHQIYFPKNTFGSELTLGMIDKLLNHASLWKLKCNITDEAAVMAFNAMTKGKNR